MILAGLVVIAGPVPSASADSTISLTFPAGMVVDVPAMVAGTLSDGGTSIGGALLLITDTPASGGSERSRSVTTAADGSFDFSYAARSYADTIVVNYAGDETHPPVTQTFKPQANRRPLELVLDAPDIIEPLSTVTIRGSLTSLGDPVPGFELQTMGNCDGNLSGTIVTDQDGRFTLTDTPPRSCPWAMYGFLAWDQASDVYGPLEMWHTVTIDWDRSEMHLEPQRATVVVDSTMTWTGGVSVAGAPRGGVPVRATVSLDDDVVAVEQLTTDEAGAFAYSQTLDRVGRWRVDFLYEGDDQTFYSTQGSSMVVEPHATRVTFDEPSMSAHPGDTITVSGALLRDGDEPMVDMPLDVFHGDQPVTSLRTDEQGRFAFDQTVAEASTYPYDRTDDYRVHFAADDRHAEATGFQSVLVERKPTHITLDATPRTTQPGDVVEVSGVLEEGGGAPVSGAPVRVSIWTAGDLYHEARSVTTDEAGGFSFPVAADGGVHYEVRAAFAGTPRLGPSEGGTSWDGEPLPGVLTLDGPGSVLHGEGIQLEGRISDTAGVGDPTTLDVRITDENGDWVDDGIALADDDGKFQVPFRGMAVGHHTIAVTNRTWRTAAQTVSVDVTVRPLVFESRAEAPAARRSGWAIYSAQDEPRITTRITPAREGMCLKYYIQEWTDGRWLHRNRSLCRTTNDAGRTFFRFRGPHEPDSRFRLRPEWGPMYTDPAGDWVRVRFR